jgi:hypothetical protein
MTAHVNTKSRRVGLPAEAVICRGSELAYDALRRASLRALFHTGLTVSQVARYFAINPVQVQMLNVRSPTDSTRRLSGGSAGGRVTRSAKRACRTSLGAAEGPLRPAR